MFQIPDIEHDTNQRKVKYSDTHKHIRAALTQIFLYTRPHFHSFESSFTKYNIIYINKTTTTTAGSYSILTHLFLPRCFSFNFLIGIKLHATMQFFPYFPSFIFHFVFVSVRLNFRFNFVLVFVF